MERVPVKHPLSLALAAAMLVAAVAEATPPPPRNLAKTRPGSFLKRDKPWDEPADLRGEAERRRDREIVTHYRRMATLDVLSTVAQSDNDLGLLESIEDVRRKEVERHHKVMMRLKRDMSAVVLAGTP
jgi:hypothetical protein